MSAFFQEGAQRPLPQRLFAAVAGGWEMGGRTCFGQRRRSRRCVALLPQQEGGDAVARTPVRPGGLADAGEGSLFLPPAFT